MKTSRTTLLTTAAALLVISTACSFAQSPEKQQAPARAPAAQQSAPADKMAPPMHAGQPKAADPAAKPETTGQAPSPGPQTHDMKDMKPGADMKAQPPQHSDAAPKADMKGDNKAPATTGQGAGRGAAQLSAEQRTKISTVIRQQKVEPAKVNISVSVGTRVPQEVRYYPLPTEVVTIYPEWRGYDYIVVGATIVVVDPATREVVAILEA